MYLVNVDEEWLKNDDVEVVRGEPVTDLPQLGHHLLLHVRVDDVVALRKEEGEQMQTFSAKNGSERKKGGLFYNSN